MSDDGLDAALLERWALAYLGRFASSAENLRRVLLRRVRRHGAGADEQPERSGPLIDALIARYLEAGLLDDMAYAAARAQARHRRGESLSRIRAGLAAKGIAAPVAAAAVGGLREAVRETDLVAACAFARRRRLGPYRRGIADRSRDLAAFARAGFGRREAEAVLACPDPEAVEALAREPVRSRFGSSLR